MDNIIKTKGSGDVLKDFTDLMDTIYAYGPEKTIQIAATMQKETLVPQNVLKKLYKIRLEFVDKIVELV